LDGGDSGTGDIAAKGVGGDAGPGIAAIAEGSATLQKGRRCGDAEVGESSGRGIGIDGVFVQRLAA